MDGTREVRLLRQCVVDGCFAETRYLRKGMCDKHYRRVLRNGTIVPKVIFGDNKSRFLSKVAINSESGCWLWTDYLDDDGYGQFKVSGKTLRAHRWIYSEYYNGIDSELVIDHLCRVRRCVNPEHMELVTTQENSARGNGSRRYFQNLGHCTHGHEYVDGSYFILGDGSWRCRDCSNAAWRRWYRKKNMVSPDNYKV